MYAKVSKKGQVTIPKAIREKLKLKSEGGVLFIVKNETVQIKGVPGEQAGNLAGSLRKFAKRHVPLSEIRKQIKGQIANDAAGEGLSD